MNSENYFKNQRRTSSRLCCMFHGTPCMILQLRKKKNNRKYLKSPSTFHFFYRTFYCQILDNFCVGYRSAETTVFYFQPPPPPHFSSMSHNNSRQYRFNPSPPHQSWALDCYHAGSTDMQIVETKQKPIQFSFTVVVCYTLQFKDIHFNFNLYYMSLQFSFVRSIFFTLKCC